MLNLVDSSRVINRKCLHGVIACACFIFSSQSVVIAAEEASTTMTVITVDNWNGSPSVHQYYTVDTLLDAVYRPGSVSWMTDPYPRRWGETMPNGVTGNLWTIKTYNGGQTYSAIAWDFIGNTTTSKGCCGGGVAEGTFTMLSSLCDQGRSGLCATPQRVRTNMVRWPSIISTQSTISIEPQNVGVFSSQDSQTFTAYMGTTKLKATDLDWSISESPTDGQGLKPEEIATIDENGVATILNTKGTVKVSACYPKGCGSGNKVNSIVYHLLLRTQQ